MGGKNLEMSKTFVRCEMCGKKLIERKPNGLWYFLFGRRTDKDGNEVSPVEIYIHGSLKMKCIRRTCEHWNILHYFPNQR